MSEQEQEQQTPESPTERPPSDDQQQGGAPEADPTTPGIKSPPNEEKDSDS
jgi:hypothetical protein